MEILADLGDVSLARATRDHVGTIERLLADGYRLLDAQFITDHLSTFGAIEIPRAEYHRRLARALQAQASLQRVAVGTGAAALQVISQAS